MAIDASIYSQLRQPEAPNLLAELAGVQQLQALQTQNQLAQLGFADRERGLREAEEMRGAVRTFGADTTANYNRLLQTGNLSAAQSYLKGVSEQQEVAAKTGKAQAETADKVFGTFQQAIGSVQTREQAAQVIAAGYNDPQIGPVLQKLGRGKTLEQALTEIPADPQAFRQWQAQAAIGAEKLAQFAKVSNVNLGGTMVTQQVQPATGQVTQLASAPITQTADNAATNARIAADAAAGRAVQIRGQNMTDARSREANAAVSGGVKAPAGYRWKADGTLEPIPGGPASVAGGKGDKPPAEVRRMNIALRSLEEGLDVYEQKLATFNARSFDQLKPAERAAMESLYADMQMQMKEAQALGALTGPDMAVLERTLASPASMRGMVYGNEGLKGQLRESRAALQRRKAAVAAEFGTAPAAAAAPAPAASKPGRVVNFADLK